MSNELTLPPGFGPLPAAFANVSTENDDLSSGVASSYGVVGYKGKVWSIRFGGEEKILMRDDGDGARGSIEVVLIKAAPAISKIFYKSGYVEGSNAAPDCWSANGVTPDASVQAKVHATCADCPMNAWGSRITEGGKNGKACADSRRMAIVPLQDIDNDLFGGPMLLRVPAASLKDLKAYGDLLKQYNYPYYAVATRISFDVNEAYPKFVFGAIRPLTQEEAMKIAPLRDDPRVKTVLNETAVSLAESAAPVEEKAPNLFESAAPAPTPAPKPAVTVTPAVNVATTTAAPPAAPQKSAAQLAREEAARRAQELAAEAARLAALAAEPDEETGEITEESTDATVAAFDDMLANIIKN